VLGTKSLYTYLYIYMYTYIYMHTYICKNRYRALKYRYRAPTYRCRALKYWYRALNYRYRALLNPLQQHISKRERCGATIPLTFFQKQHTPFNSANDVSLSLSHTHTHPSTVRMMQPFNHSARQLLKSLKAYFPNFLSPEEITLTFRLMRILHFCRRGPYCS